jgi:lactoylglutathione lyase
MSASGGQSMQHPTINLVVIRSNDIDRLARFYGLIGLDFHKHRHGSGPEHCVYEHGGCVFEIYPRQGNADTTAGLRIGFRVQSVDATIAALIATGAHILSPARTSPWGRRAVVEDPDGHHVELTELSVR